MLVLVVVNEKYKMCPRSGSQSMEWRPGHKLSEGYMRPSWGATRYIHLVDPREGARRPWSDRAPAPALSPDGQMDGPLVGRMGKALKHRT